MHTAERWRNTKREKKTSNNNNKNTKASGCKQFTLARRTQEQESERESEQANDCNFSAMAFLCDSYARVCKGIWMLTMALSTLQFPLQHCFSAVIDNFNKIDTYNPQEYIPNEIFYVFFSLLRSFFFRLVFAFFICQGTQLMTIVPFV